MMVENLVRDIKMLKTHLLIIDPQVDFCDPNGALYVKGAEKDMERLSNFINIKGDEINNIFVTLDSHNKFDVAHPIFWHDIHGKSPKPFTIISTQDVRDGKWIPFSPKVKERMIFYLERLEEGKRYPLCIWPPHCLIGSTGQSIYPLLFNSLNKWQKIEDKIDYIEKGKNIYTEHYSAFKAEVPDTTDPSTKLNTILIDLIWAIADKVYIAGEAGSHCVANTIRDMVEYYEENKKEIYYVKYNLFPRIPFPEKTILLEDTMSPVPGFENLQNEFFEEAKSKGIQILKTTEIKD